MKYRRVIPRSERTVVLRAPPFLLYDRVNVSGDIEKKVSGGQ